MPAFRFWSPGRSGPCRYRPCPAVPCRSRRPTAPALLAGSESRRWRTRRALRSAPAIDPIRPDRRERPAVLAGSTGSAAPRPIRPIRPNCRFRSNRPMFGTEIEADPAAGRSRRSTTRRASSSPSSSSPRPRPAGTGRWRLWGRGWRRACRCGTRTSSGEGGRAGGWGPPVLGHFLHSVFDHNLPAYPDGRELWSLPAGSVDQRRNRWISAAEVRALLTAQRCSGCSPAWPAQRPAKA